MDIKLNFGLFVLNVLDVKFGLFHSSIREHSHSHGSYELHYIPGGQGTLVAQGQRYSLIPGTLFMTGPDVAHEQIPVASDPMAEYCIFFQLLPGDSRQIINKHSHHQLLYELLINHPFWIGQDCEDLMTLFNMLAEELSAKRTGFHHAATNILEIIVTRVLRQFLEHDASPKAADIPLKTLDDSRLLTIENSFLYEFHSITLSQLACRLGLGIRQTERIVQKQYNLSFNEKKKQSRMSAAAQLLKTTDRAIHSIAEDTGFASAEQFSHAFKRYFGMTATQYRSRHHAGLHP
ncbi:AraC family transcriptional regulator [Paenibacillus lemnae]|nr:AraC family transcriptional regulator [Paenibacillus lemnae]